MGIDLGTSGITPNDAGDADTGANNLQDFPVIQTAFTNRIIGTLNSLPNKTYTVELYRNNACDASGSGEGQFYLGSQTVMTDGGGSATIDAIVALNAGEIVSATATDASGNTSEFAQCYVATAAAPGTLSFSTATYTAGEGAGTATIGVTRAFGSTGAISVHYETSDGTATAGQDYAATSGTLIFYDGQTSASLTISVLQDNIGEADETVFITLSNPNGGATLGNPSSRTLLISDDDSGLPGSVLIRGNIVENNQPLANVSVTLAGSQSKTALTDALGNYQFTSLTGGGNYLVTPTLNGRTFEPFNLSYSNLSTDVTNANFVGATGTPSRLLRVAGGDTVSGNSVIVPVELVGQGNENSVGFVNSTQIISITEDQSDINFILNSIARRFGQ